MHRKIKGEYSDAIGQQLVESLLCVPAAAAVAVAVDHDWQAAQTQCAVRFEMAAF